MRFLILALFFISSVSAAPQFWNSPSEGKSKSKISLEETFDESVNFQPGLNLYNDAAQLTDLFGTKGSQLCAPNSITHAVTFLKYSRNPNFANLMSAPDMDQDGTADTYKDKIRYFFQACQTDRENGTYYQQAIECMKKYVSDSGYTSFTFMIGPHSKEAPAGYRIEDVKRTITTSDLRYYVANQVPVIMGIGWYKFNTTTQTYERTGGHFFNIYGYDYNAAFGDDKMILKVVNSWINYTGRERANMFDDVTMTRVTGLPTYYPDQVVYELSGPGFIFNEYKALVEDLFIMFPVARP